MAGAGSSRSRSRCGGGPVTASPPTALHYFHCLRIVEILRGTEASTRNLFGRYSSQRMKVSGDRDWDGAGSSPRPCHPPPLPSLQDWQEIVALYEKENTYLGEPWGGGARGGLPWATHSQLRVPGAGRDPCGSSGPRHHPAAELASLLVRSVSYEVPALRKQISRCQQAQQDFARREEECQLAAAELRERFYASCKQYGITVSPQPRVPGVSPQHRAACGGSWGWRATPLPLPRSGSRGQSCLGALGFCFPTPTHPCSTPRGTTCARSCWPW